MGETRSVILERTYQLEAKPLKDFETEIKEMENNLGKNIPKLSDDLIFKHIKLINEIKDSFPHLLENKADNIRNFKSVTSFASRMGDWKLKYYHVYRFACMFAHPSPKLKEFFMKRSCSKNAPMDALVEPLKQVLISCLLFSHMLLLASRNILASNLLDNSDELKALENDFFAIYEEAYNNIF